MNEKVRISVIGEKRLRRTFAIVGGSKIYDHRRAKEEERFCQVPATVIRSRRARSVKARERP